MAGHGSLLQLAQEGVRRHARGSGLLWWQAAAAVAMAERLRAAGVGCRGAGAEQGRRHARGGGCTGSRACVSEAGGWRPRASRLGWPSRRRARRPARPGLHGARSRPCKPVLRGTGAGWCGTPPDTPSK